MKHRQLDKRIGQLIASQYEIEPHLTDDEFVEYSDSLITCVAYLNKVKKEIPKQ